MSNLPSLQWQVGHSTWAPLTGYQAVTKGLVATPLACMLLPQTQSQTHYSQPYTHIPFLPQTNRYSDSAAAAHTPELSQSQPHMQAGVLYILTHSGPELRS